MNDGTVLLLALTSSILAALAVIVSFLVLRKVSALRRDTTRLSSLLDFNSLEDRRRRIFASVNITDNSLKAMSDDSRQLAADLSKTFARVAYLLSETHKLEGNPHPKLDTDKLHEINSRLLSIGESSLSATRIAETLTKNAEELRSGIGELRESMDKPNDDLVD